MRTLYYLFQPSGEGRTRHELLVGLITNWGRLRGTKIEEWGNAGNDNLLGVFVDHAGWRTSDYAVFVKHFKGGGVFAVGKPLPAHVIADVDDKGGEVIDTIRLPFSRETAKRVSIAWNAYEEERTMLKEVQDLAGIMPLAQISEQSGVSPAHLSRIFAGKQKVSLGVYLRLRGLLLNSEDSGL
jgi:AraC-like DNA-binding protein